MRTSTVFAVFLTIGISFAAKAGSIPAPIFYQLSKTILNKTQHLVEDEVKPQKVKVVKDKMTPCPLKCQPKKDQTLKNIGTVNYTSPKSLWQIDTES